MRKPILQVLPAVWLATGMGWAAESPFIGEWKLDATKSRMPDEMKVQSKGANTYAFDSGLGAETIVADGSDQPAYGGTLLSVKAEAPDTWIVQRKKDGRLLLNAGPGGASSSIRRVDERTLVITDKAGGMVTDTEEIGLSTDLKTLTITVHVPGRDKPNVMVFERK